MSVSSPPPPPFHAHREKHHHSCEDMRVTSSPERMRSAIHTANSVGLLKLLMEETANMPYKTKKQQGASNDMEYVQKLIQEMNDILKHEFLHVDLDNSLIRNVLETDWSTLTACKRSDSGTTGIIFLQCLTPQKILEVVVAKPTTIADYEKTMYVSQIASKYFFIPCPAVRFIDRSETEFVDLEEQVKKLFLPLNEELYHLGGHHSPKDLFSSQGIMLLEFVRGQPLCHKSLGQRFLTGDDYYALGKVFLLDLLIRNTDRLPCRKTMPRPGSKAVNDHGNPGNIMFGPTAGEVWSIDPEMQTKVDLNVEQVYGDGFESVVREVVNDESSKPRYKALESLFFAPLPGLVGIIDVSLNELSPWETASSAQRQGIDIILQLIRLRATAEDNYIIRRSGNLSPPATSDERDWREWIRHAAPRAMLDIFEFLEALTGHHTPPYASAAFESGFVDSLYAAQRFRSDNDESEGRQELSQYGTIDTNKDPPNIDVKFILRMIDRTTKYLTGAPTIHSKRYSYGGPMSATKSERRRSIRGAFNKQT
jgi:hypothetical protein